MTHVRTPPCYPQRKGKVERWNGILKPECIPPLAPLNLKDACQIVKYYIYHYNN
ncbi:MAG: transposase [Anaerolineaceae bacterium]|nr:transposase [Anaerolineaceae bacterium]